jgi:hypothetical protein
MSGFSIRRTSRASERFSGCRFLVIEEDPTSQPHNLFSGPDQPLAALRSRFFTEESRAARPSLEVQSRRPALASKEKKASSAVSKARAVRRSADDVVEAPC